MTNNMGWVYFLKQDYKNSIINLIKAGNEDDVNLLQFVKSIDNVQYVPAPIHALYRDIRASNFIDKVQVIHMISQRPLFLS